MLAAPLLASMAGVWFSSRSREEANHLSVSYFAWLDWFSLVLFWFCLVCFYLCVWFGFALVCFGFGLGQMPRSALAPEILARAPRCGYRA